MIAVYRVGDQLILVVGKCMSKTPTDVDDCHWAAGLRVGPDNFWLSYEVTTVHPTDVLLAAPVSRPVNSASSIMASTLNRPPY